MNFPNARVRNLRRRSSYHLPLSINLTLDLCTIGKSWLFLFEAARYLHAAFKTMLCDCWGETNMNLMENIDSFKARANDRQEMFLGASSGIGDLIPLGSLRHLKLK